MNCDCGKEVLQFQIDLYGMCAECLANDRAQLASDLFGAQRSNLLKACGVAEIYLNCSSLNWRHEWSHWPEVQGGRGFVLLYGPVGTGKTHFGTALFADDVMSSKSGFWTETADLISTMRSDYDSSLIRRCKSVEVLMLDDFPPEHITPFSLGLMSEIITSRFNGNKRTIVTINMKPEELPSISSKLASRLLSGQRVEFTGKDRRL